MVAYILIGISLVLFGAATAAVASSKGYGRTAWFVIGALTGLIGLIVAFAIRPKGSERPAKARAAGAGRMPSNVLGEMQAPGFGGSQATGPVADAALCIAVHDPDVYVESIEGSMLLLVASALLGKEAGLELDPNAYVRFGVLMGGDLREQEQRVQGELRTGMASIMAERGLLQSRYEVRGPFVTENDRGAKFYWVAAVRR